MRRLEASTRRRVERLFEEHRSLIEQVAAKRVPQSDVPDVVQEVGLEMCRSIRSLREPGAVRHWLFKVTVYAAAARHRKEGQEARRRARLALAMRPDRYHVTPAAPEGADPLPADYAPTERHLLEAEQREVDTRVLETAISQLRPVDRCLLANPLTDGPAMTSKVGVGRSNARNVRMFEARQRLKGIMRRDPRCR